MIYSEPRVIVPAFFTPIMMTSGSLFLNESGFKITNILVTVIQHK